MKRKGFRSEFERSTAVYLIKNNIKYGYETTRILYQPPMKKYTPDFHIINNGIFIETKGYFEYSDRMKHLLVKKQNPNFDIRFLFVNAKNKINKFSKTTYGEWCDKHNIKWAERVIPKIWLR